MSLLISRCGIRDIKKYLQFAVWAWCSRGKKAFVFIVIVIQCVFALHGVRYFLCRFATTNLQ